jgi:hypothetical protein
MTQATLVTLRIQSIWKTVMSLKCHQNVTWVRGAQ